MAGNKALFLLFAVLPTSSVYGQNGILGGTGTYCSDGWKFSASYVLEPWSPGQHVSIEGLSEVLHTDAKDGRPDIFHRLFVDPAARTYWGYDVEVEQQETGSARLRFLPFSLHADQLPTNYHPTQILNVGTFHALPAPQIPAGTFRSGQVIEVEVLRNAMTGQKVVDYIEVEFEPIYASNKAAPRDFTTSDVLLRLVDPSLRVNGADVPPALTVADRSLKSRLIWISLSGGGRFLFSLSPYAGYPFRKAGVVSQFGISFLWNGNRYDVRTRTQITESSGNWNLYVLSAPPGSADTSGHGFSYGELNSVEEFFAKTQ